MVLTESKLLESTALGLGVEQEDKGEFEEDPSTVDGHVLPVDGSKSDRVDVGGEEATALAENLFDSDTHGPLGVGEEFDEVSCLMLAVIRSNLTGKTYCM